MKHAFLIIAHKKWDQLKILIQMLDHPENDIYIHVDAKVKSFPEMELLTAAVQSRVQIYSRYKVYWGSYELVQTEIHLFREASKVHHDYYHLLSGMDLPIKKQEDIHHFFQQHKGFEFVHFNTDERLRTDHEIQRRTRLYHYLQNYRRRYKSQSLNGFFTFLERISLVVQLIFGIDRMKKHPDLKIRYGSQWVSITEELVSYILTQEKLIEDVFRKTNCADELFIQTIVYNSVFKGKLYDRGFGNDIHANMRLIDMQRGTNGNPYIWKRNNWDEIVSSGCLFARKFDSDVDIEIIEKIQNEYGYR